MFICVCKGVSDTTIVQSVQNGACSYREVRDECGAGTQCGKCVRDTQHLISQTLKSKSN